MFVKPLKTVLTNSPHLMETGRGGRSGEHSTFQGSDMPPGLRIKNALFTQALCTQQEATVCLLYARTWHGRQQSLAGKPVSGTVDCGGDSGRRPLTISEENPRHV